MEEEAKKGQLPPWLMKKGDKDKDGDDDSKDSKDDKDKKSDKAKSAQEAALDFARAVSERQ